MTDGDKLREKTNFYIPSSDVQQNTDQSNLSLETADSLLSNSNSVHYGMIQSVTLPQLHIPDSTELTNSTFRTRANSAPSILYQQVALELRNISDCYCAEYDIKQVS